jgi:hypothetical protein
LLMRDLSWVEVVFDALTEPVRRPNLELLTAGIAARWLAGPAATRTCACGR